MTDPRPNLGFSSTLVLFTLGLLVSDASVIAHPRSCFLLLCTSARTKLARPLCRDRLSKTDVQPEKRTRKPIKMPPKLDHFSTGHCNHTFRLSNDYRAIGWSPISTLSNIEKTPPSLKRTTVPLKVTDKCFESLDNFSQMLPIINHTNNLGLPCCTCSTRN